MRRRTISLLFGLLVLVLNLNIPVYSSDIETKTNDYNKMMEEVNEAMSKYDRTGAYDLLLVMEETLTVDVDRALYMEMLSKMMIIEEYYWLIAPLTTHTIELYELAVDAEQYEYMMQAKFILSTIEYNNYENRASLETLNELVAIEFEHPNILYQVRHLYGVALLAYDDGEYSRSRTYIDEAMDIVDSHPENHNILWYDAANLLRVKGFGYEYEGEFELAMECHEQALALVPTDALYDFEENAITEQFDTKTCSN